MADVNEFLAYIFRNFDSEAEFDAFLPYHDNDISRDKQLNCSWEIREPLVPLFSLEFIFLDVDCEAWPVVIIIKIK